MAQHWSVSRGHSGGRGRSIAANGFHYGATGGGVWKTTDGGANWESVSDGSVFGTAQSSHRSFVPPEHSLVLAWVNRRLWQMSHAMVFIMTDAGKTWKRIGFKTRVRSTRIRVHPKNPDLVYGCAWSVWGPNDQRGVFRLKDGNGKVLSRGNKAGAIDLTLIQSHMYAGFWEVYRKP